MFKNKKKDNINDSNTDNNIDKTADNDKDNNDIDKKILMSAITMMTKLIIILK